MNHDVVVAGVGMIQFTKPGANEPYPQMAAKAVRLALADAGMGYELIPSRLCWTVTILMAERLSQIRLADF